MPTEHETRGRSGSELAHLGGWLLAPFVNAVFAALLLPPADARTRTLHLLYDFGQFLAIGLIAAAIVRLGRRSPPRSPIFGWVLLACVAIIVGFHVLPEDLDNFSRSFPGPQDQWLAGLVITASLIVPAGAIAGRIAARMRLRWMALAVAVALFAANNLMLQRDYEGGHLMLTWSAASLAGASLVGAPLPRALARFVRLRGWPRSAILVPLLMLATWAVLVAPPAAVHVRMVELGGSTPAQQLGQIRERMARDEPLEETDPESEQWFHDRSDRPPIPPREPRVGPRDPIVVLLTIDSMRAELLEDGSYRAALPRLWELAGRSIRFIEARAPGASTLTVMGSLFTGKHRTQLHWRRTRRLKWNLADDPTERVVETIAAAGIPSFQTVAYEYLRTRYGITRGFTDELFIAPPEGQRFALSREMIEPLVARLREHDDGPLFLHAHLMDAHYPYDAAGRTGDDWEDHLAELELCDRAVGELWDEARRLGLSERLVLIVGSDHGEAFGQHNTPHHGNTVYEELVRIPLFITVPGLPARVVEAPISLIDLGPTILDLFGLATPGHHMGESLTPLLVGEEPFFTRPIAGTARVAGKRPVHYYFMSDDHKVIWNLRLGTREVYDLSEDPAEEVNLFDHDDEDVRARMALLLRFFRSHPYFDDGRKRSSRRGARDEGDSDDDEDARE